MVLHGRSGRELPARLALADWDGQSPALRSVQAVGLALANEARAEAFTCRWETQPGQPQKHMLLEKRDTEPSRGTQLPRISSGLCIRGG